MNRHDEEQLLNEILAGEEVGEFRQASLARTLSAMQRRKRRQRGLRAAALAALPVMLALAAFWRQPARTDVRPKLPGNPAVANNAAPIPADSASVKFITDEELFALFPDRSVALIGPPGHQQFVFLDEPAGRKPRQSL